MSLAPILPTRELEDVIVVPLLPADVPLVVWCASIYRGSSAATRDYRKRRPRPPADREPRHDRRWYDTIDDGEEVICARAGISSQEEGLGAMTTLHPDAIARELGRRGCSLYHAINLPDLRTYLERGALLSRDQLASTEGGIRTTFVSDATDDERGVLDRCFGNLADFGRLFWESPQFVPNCYGPVSLAFGPPVWGYVTDLALTMKNAMARDYNLEADRLRNEEAISSLFRSDQGAGLSYDGAKVEVSTGTNALPLSFLTEIVVEPIMLDQTTLVDVVHGEVLGAGLSVKVTERSTGKLGQERLELLTELVRWCIGTSGEPTAPAKERFYDLATWYGGLSPRFRGLLLRWCRYTKSTVSCLVDEETERLWTMERDAFEQVVRNWETDDGADEEPCQNCGAPQPLECPGCGGLFCATCFYGDASTDAGHTARQEDRCAVSCSRLLDNE